VVHLTMQIPPDSALPSFIDLQDVGGHLAEHLFVFTDQHRRRCFRCGHTGHVGQFCWSSLKVVGAPPNLWSTLVLPDSLSGQPPAVEASPPAAAPSAAASAAPLPRVPVVPQPGGSTAPLPPTDQRDRVFFGVEDSSPSEPPTAAHSEPSSSPPSPSRLRRSSASPAAGPPPSGLPVVVKSKPQTPAARGGQLAGKARSGATKSACQSLSPAADNRKRAADPLVGAAKLRTLALTPPSQHISDSSIDGGDE
jgi:hypothetical protein